jgi:large subunit ribosomal protein L37Ae
MHKTGLGGGLSTRYGTAPRRVYVEILTQLRRRHECPRCRAMAVKRVSVGLWQCRKCGNQFTGGAYTPSTKIGEVSRRSVVASIQSRVAPEETKSEITPPEPSKPKKVRRRKAEQVKEKEEPQ